MEAISPFPDQRIFSANLQTFLEFDRQTGGWKRVRYDETSLLDPSPSLTLDYDLVRWIGLATDFDVAQLFAGRDRTYV